jgi:hypothetical protein
MEPKITHWHGMTRKAFESFIQGKGKREAGITPWIVSDNDGFMYFYSAEKLQKEYDCEYEYIASICIERAKESAEIQAAVNAETDIVIIGFDLSSIDYEDDLSCEFMDSVADCARESEVNIGLAVKVFKYKFNTYASPFVVSGLLDNPHFNRYELDPMLEKMAEVLSNSKGVFIDPSEYSKEVQELDLSEFQ